MQKSASIPCLDPLLEQAGLCKSISMLLDKRLSQWGVPRSEQHRQDLRAHCPHQCRGSLCSLSQQPQMQHLLAAATQNQKEIMKASSRKLTPQPRAQHPSQCPLHGREIGQKRENTGGRGVSTCSQTSHTFPRSIWLWPVSVQGAGGDRQGINPAWRC